MTGEEQVSLYCEQKEKEKILHASNEQLGKTIKADLLNTEDKSVEYGKYKVYLQSRSTDVVDEIKALEVLKNFWEDSFGSAKCPFIKTVEMIDTEALEGCIYRGEIPDEVLLALDKCRSQKVTYALYYKVAKEEK